MSGKKIVLDEIVDWSEFTIFGLVSDAPDYKICFHLNSLLGLEMARAKNDYQVHYKGQTHFYPHYFCFDPMKDVYWNFTSNKYSYLNVEQKETNGGLFDLPQTKQLLIPNLPFVDYFFWIEGNFYNTWKEELNVKLNQMSYVRTLQVINAERTKNIKNLIIPD